jgi:hypothetical protein
MGSTDLVALGGRQIQCALGKFRISQIPFVGIAFGEALELTARNADDEVKPRLTSG